MENIANQIESRIINWGKGKIFFSSDFADLGTPDAVRQKLNRMCKSNDIIRLARGIFYSPKIDTKWGLGMIHPSLEEVAQSIAKHDKIRISPTGIYALNALGLSTQVPANVVYLTDGAPRHISIGKGRGIVFIHTSEVKKLALKSPLMELIVSAMREIGEDNITEAQLEIIKKHLANVPKSDFDNDIKLVPDWVRKTLLSL